MIELRPDLRKSRSQETTRRRRKQDGNDAKGRRRRRELLKRMLMIGIIVDQEGLLLHALLPHPLGEIQELPRLVLHTILVLSLLVLLTVLFLLLT
jgi:hypothetical protein